MPQLRDFLSRFRPAGAPGAGRAAVPASGRGRVAAELEPVLRLLDAEQAECAGIVAAARRDAEQAVSAARADAAALAAAVALQAEDIRQRAAGQSLASARAEAASMAAAAAEAAGQARERARQRIPALAEHAVSLVRDLADAAGAGLAGGGAP